MVTPPVVLADEVAIRVTSLAVAGAASPADPAGVVAADVTTLDDAGMVTVSVADLADAGLAFPADFAGVVTVGVAPLADAGVVTVGVTGLAGAGSASLAVAGMAFPTDFAVVVTVGVASLTNAVMALPADIARVVTVGVAPLADARAASLAYAEMALPADPAGVKPHIGVASPADAGLATVGVADLADDGVLLRAAHVAVVNCPVMLFVGDIGRCPEFGLARFRFKWTSVNMLIVWAVFQLDRDCSVPAAGCSSSFGTRCLIRRILLQVI